MRSEGDGVANRGPPYEDGRALREVVFLDGSLQGVLVDGALAPILATKREKVRAPDGGQPNGAPLASVQISTALALGRGSKPMALSKASSPMGVDHDGSGLDEAPDVSGPAGQVISSCGVAPSGCITDVSISRRPCVRGPRARFGRRALTPEIRDLDPVGDGDSQEMEV